MLCSAACMVHCMVLPLLILALPVLTNWLAVPEIAHVWLLAFAAPAAALALTLGHRSHRHWTPVVSGAGGLALLSAAIFAEGATETALTVAGSILIVSAHLRNLRLRRRCACCA